ncbi:MAG TPA: SRPBCC family protein [Pyrinomonadaceae bacterium]|nr:SRPBCC family protein [Pyrinomonadaceae bacterium]
MSSLVVETLIHAPPERCFDLVRTAQLDLVPVAGSGSGVVAAGQIATFKVGLLGAEFRLVFEVVDVERPRKFVDVMKHGPFASFRHVHEFTPQGPHNTILRDTVEWCSPFGLLGSIADRLFVARRLGRSVAERNANLKRLAETGRD